MSLRNNKEYVELFLREMVRTASTAGDKIEGIVLGIPAFRYLGSRVVKNSIYFENTLRSCTSMSL